MNPDIAKYWKLDEHANKPIVIYKSKREHIIERHLNDFGSVEKIDYIWSKLRKIIKKPDEVFYNEKTKGLEFYKRFDNIILVAVRISFGSSLKIKSFYPVKERKLKNRKLKEEKLIIDEVIDENISI